MEIQKIHDKKVVTIENIYIEFGFVLANKLINSLVINCENFVVEYSDLDVFVDYEKLCDMYYELTGNKLGDYNEH